MKGTESSCSSDEQGEIGREISSLKSMVTCLEDVAETHGEILKPILHESSPEAGDKTGTPDAVTPVGDTLQSLNRRLNYVINTLRSINERIAL